MYITRYTRTKLNKCLSKDFMGVAKLFEMVIPRMPQATKIIFKMHEQANADF